MYHLEIDALNALVAEQKRTNELLEKLVQTQRVEADVATEQTKPQPKTTRGRRKRNVNKP